MKGIILAAGRGSRINDVTQGKSKCLLEVSNEAIISRNVKRLCGLDIISECIIVVGFEAEAIMRVVGNVCNNKRVSYCIQQEQKGLINALESAKWAIGKSDVFMVLGDEYLVEENYDCAINTFVNHNYDCLIGIIKATDVAEVRKTYSFQLDENRIYNFVEKPEVPFNLYKGTGNVIIKNHVLDTLDAIPVNPKRGEKELVDLFNCLNNQNGKVGAFIVANEYYNVNTKEDYDLLLKSLNR